MTSYVHTRDWHRNWALLSSEFSWYWTALFPINFVKEMYQMLLVFVPSPQQITHIDNLC